MKHRGSRIDLSATAPKLSVNATTAKTSFLRWHRACCYRHRMPKEGLTALAESYGLERNELHQLKILAESFFDKLREDLLSYASRSIRMLELSQSTASVSDFATDPVAARHLVFLGFAAQTIAVIRLDDVLARALVDCMLGGADAKPSSPERKMSAVEERVIANTIGAAIVKTAQRVLGPILHDNVNIRLLRIQHRPGVVADTLPPSEQMVTARVRCDSRRQRWMDRARAPLHSHLQNPLRPDPGARPHHRSRGERASRTHPSGRCRTGTVRGAGTREPAAQRHPQAAARFHFDAAKDSPRASQPRAALRRAATIHRTNHPTGRMVSIFSRQHWRNR